MARSYPIGVAFPLPDRVALRAHALVLVFARLDLPFGGAQSCVHLRKAHSTTPEKAFSVLCCRRC